MESAKRDLKRARTIIMNRDEQLLLSETLPVHPPLINLDESAEVAVVPSNSSNVNINVPMPTNNTATAMPVNNTAESNQQAAQDNMNIMDMDIMAMARSLIMTGSVNHTNTPDDSNILALGNDQHLDLLMSSTPSPDYSAPGTDINTPEPDLVDVEQEHMDVGAPER